MLPALVILAMLTVPALGRTFGGGLPFIVNGNDVDVVGKYPYQASYQYRGNHNCGAAIISDKYLISAAHCCSGASAYYTIVVGAHDIKTKTKGDPTTYNLASTMRNPGYGKGTGLNEGDVCIIKLTSNIDMTNQYVETIDLPAVGSTDQFVGKDCIITGWGNTKIGSTGSPNVLQEADTNPLSLAACRTAVAKHRLFDEGDVVASHICIGAAGSDKAGGCHGDSGGPMACPNSAGNKVLAGVTSWGSPDCDPQYPTMYTRITSFRDWINENTGI